MKEELETILLKSYIRKERTLLWVVSVDNVL